MHEVKRLEVINEESRLESVETLSISNLQTLCSLLKKIQTSNFFQVSNSVCKITDVTHRVSTIILEIYSCFFSISKICGEKNSTNLHTHSLVSRRNRLSRRFTLQKIKVTVWEKNQFIDSGQIEIIIKSH